MRPWNGVLHFANDKRTDPDSLLAVTGAMLVALVLVAFFAWLW